MLSLRDYIAQASEEKRAIGHFNASNIEMVWAIFRAAKTLNAPVIIGFSEGERDFIGVRQAVGLIASIREEHNYPIFSNADHTYSFERVKEAVDAGFDAVIFDGAELSFDENVRVTKQCVAYARSKRSDMLVEGELGFIGKSSSVRTNLPAGVKLDEEHLTKPDEAKRYVDETRVDLLAPSVGNIHGMFKNGRDPALSIARIKEIREAGGVPLVLHGASGNSDDDVRAACSAGAAIVHVSTELRLAYRKALQLSLQSDPEQVAPYKYLKPAVAAVEKIVAEKLTTLT